MIEDKKFWDNKAKTYNKMFKTYKPYQEMYEFIKESLTKEMQVLEVATGTGLIASEISSNVKNIEATDFSEQMIEQAKQIEHSQNINFSCADIFSLPYADSSFDVVIASNVLHIIPNPEKALQEISRVLKYDGMLISPTYLWKQLTFKGKIQKFIMKRINFPLHTEWSEKTFSDFIKKNGFSITKLKIIKSGFAIACVECKKMKA